MLPWRSPRLLRSSNLLHWLASVLTTSAKLPGWDVSKLSLTEKLGFFPGQISLPRCLRTSRQAIHLELLARLWMRGTLDAFGAYPMGAAGLQSARVRIQTKPLSPWSTLRRNGGVFSI